MEQEAVERAESFSFSCHDFNTSVAVFSDDEDSCSDESYIEIALGPASTNSFDDGKNDPEGGDKRDYQRELELRISFSSSFPLPELSKSDGFKTIGSGSETVTSLCSSATSSSTSTFRRSSSVEAKYWSAPLGTSPSKFRKTLKRKLQFPAVNRLLDTLMSSSKGSSEVRPKSTGRYGDIPEVAMETNQLDLVQDRKMSNIKNRPSRGVIMKFFMKFKSKNFRTLLASMVKPQQFSSSNQGKAGGKKSRSEEILQRNRSQVTPWDRSLVQTEQGKNRGFEMKLDAIRGVMEAMSTSFGRNDRRTRSCPGSTKSSPIHQGYTSESKVMCARDSSIQAAIAHCKRSFGQTSDFRF